MNENPPDGWVRWNDQPDRQVFVYRPDVFDSQAFPPACLPTLYVSNGPHRNRRPERHRERSRSREWYVTLYLEPEIRVTEDRYGTRTAAAEGARELARRFRAGDLDYREAYQVPREEYLDRLDELTGREA